jgi:hypothetical protein
MLTTTTHCAYKTPNFVPQIWSARLLSNLYARQVLAPLTTREYEGEIKGVGDTVNVLGVGAVSAACYQLNKATAAIVYCTVTDNHKHIQITNADYFAFRVEDIEVAQSKPAYVAELTKEAGIALAKRTDAYLYALMHDAAVSATSDCWGWKGGSSGCTGCSGKGYFVAPPTKKSCTLASTTGGGWLWKCGCMTSTCSFYNRLVQLGTYMDDNLAPEDGRFVVVPPLAKRLVLTDPRFVANNSAGQAGMRDRGSIGMIAGFELVILPRSGFTVFDTATGAPSETGSASAILCSNLYRAIAGVKGSAAFCDKISKVENVRLESHFADGVRGLHVYGGGVLRPQWLYALGFSGAI